MPLINNYCSQDTLKQRDQKQIDFESLSGYLNHLIAEKERLENPGRSNSSLSSFFRDKFDEIKGGDPERTRQERIVKLEHKIQEVCHPMQSIVNLIMKIASWSRRFQSSSIDRILGGSFEGS
jgi:sorting nexin-4